MTERSDTQTKETTPIQNSSTSRSLTVGDWQVDVGTVLKAVGLVWMFLVGWWIDGVVGMSVSLAISGVAVVAQPMIVVAVAHAGLLVLMPDLTTPISLIELGLFEVGIIAVLLGEHPFDIPVTVLTIGFGMLFVISMTAALLWGGQLAATVSLFGFVVLLAYGIHRYEQVSLGLVDEAGTVDHGASNE